MARTLFICGMPGSGKSTAGRKLASKLKWKFYDLDDYIKRLHGLSAAEMIREKGEDYFRQTEAETLREMDLSMDCIVACGGGTPCFKENLDWMQAHGTCVFLDMPLSAIESRIRQGSGFDMRPLLADEDRPLILQLEEMWEKRSPFYRKIEWWKNGLDLNPETLAEEVILKLG